LNDRDALIPLGWSDHFEQAAALEAADGLEPARISAQYKGGYSALSASGEIRADVSGRVRHFAGAKSDLPVVGDWTLLERLPGNEGLIQSVLARRTSFSRKVAGEAAQEQVMAANVDVYFIVSALDNDLNARRIERYLTMAWEGGGEPAIVLAKADLCPDVDAAVLEVEDVAPAVPLFVTNDVAGEGFDALAAHLAPNRTAVLLGSSGVGKSTIVNRLLGEDRQLVKEIREDGRGRHTTTNRELIVLPTGGLIIDTPGIRELQLWEAGEGLDDVFGDIAELSRSCRFTDCAHDTEPGCAVKAAIVDGTLTQARLNSYRKLARELAWLERRRNKRASTEESRRWRKLSAEARSRARLR
jgi:ribosome biogenesis GTPase